MLRRLPLTASAVAALALGLSATVIGAGSGGRIELEQPTRVYDSRVHGPDTFHVIGAGVFMVFALYAPDPGTDPDIAVAVVHPCAELPPEDEATFLLEPGSAQYARFATAEPVCLTSSVPTHVVVDQGGTTTVTPQPDRLQYVALGAPVELRDAPTTTREQVITIARPSALSAASGAAVLSLDVPSSSEPGWAIAYGCNGVRPLTVDLTYKPGLRTANVAYVELAPGEDICVYAHRPAHLRVKLLGELANDGPNPAALPPSWRYVPSEVPAPALAPIVPDRILDTRIALGRAGTSKVAPDEVVELDFGSLVGPETSAVVLNVTVDRPESAGYVTAWPCGGDRPEVSNLNFVAGETVPNLVVSKLGPSGTVCLSGTSRTHLVADVNGTFETDGGLRAQPIDPDRILDTRRALGVPTTTKLDSGMTLALQVTGTAVPAGAGAATVNVTVTEPDAAGYITAFPCDQNPPTASNLNFVTGQTVANLVTAKLSPDGRICLFASATTHLVADLAAWYGSDQPAGFVELAPERYLDTRNAIGTSSTTKVGRGEFISLQVAGVGDVPADADAVVMNLTATEPEAAGFVTAWPCDRSMPVVSNVNYLAGETNPNLAAVKLAADGTVCLYTSAKAHLIADVSGYLTDEPLITVDLALQDTAP